jgi:hypothetical protein
MRDSAALREAIGLDEGLDRSCSLEAFKNNVRREYHAGKTAQGTQHVAIALSVLKRSCGVDSKARMTPKEIVAAGDSKTEDNLKFGGGATGRSPSRLPPVVRGEELPVHRRAKSGKEQSFLDPEDFTLTASGTVRGEPKKKKVKKEESYSLLMSLLGAGDGDGDEEG